MNPLFRPHPPSANPLASYQKAYCIYCAQFKDAADYIRIGVPYTDTVAFEGCYTCLADLTTRITLLVDLAFACRDFITLPCASPTQEADHLCAQIYEYTRRCGF